jgi:hypothetical protein
MTQVSTCQQITTTSDPAVDERRDAPDEQQHDGPDERRELQLKRRTSSAELWGDLDAGWDLSWTKSYVNGKHREYYPTPTTR